MSYTDDHLADLRELADVLEGQAARQLTAANNVRRMLDKLKLCDRCAHPVPWHPPASDGDDRPCHGGGAYAACFCMRTQQQLLGEAGKES